MPPDRPSLPGRLPAWAGTIRAWFVLRAVTAAIFATAGLRLVYWITRLAGESPGSLGVDYGIHVRAAQRWLEGASFYEPWQLAGPYLLRGVGEVLYPPVALPLFLPFTVLPAVLWWAIPAALALAAVRRIRPRLEAWPVIALLCLYPRSQEVVLWGNPTMWVLAFALGGVAWGWPGALVLLKPSLVLFAAFGARTRGWWLTGAALALAGLLLAGMWPEWFTVLRNAQGAGPLYSLIDVPTMSIAVVAALGRTGGRSSAFAASGRPIDSGR